MLCSLNISYVKGIVPKIRSKKKNESVFVATISISIHLICIQNKYTKKYKKGLKTYISLFNYFGNPGLSGNKHIQLGAC